MSSPTHPTPTEDELEDLLLSCRYGELEEVEQFTEKFGTGYLESARDERGNTVLHMCCGNGHADVLALVEPYISEDLYTTANESGTPPLHWAILNNHLPVIQRLCATVQPTASSSSSSSTSIAPAPSTTTSTTPPSTTSAPPSDPQPAPSPQFIPPTATRKIHLLKILYQKNSAGRDALHEAVWAGDGKEEVAGWLEGLLDRLDPLLDEEEEEGQKQGKGNGDEEKGDEGKDVMEVTEKVEGVKI